VCNKFGIEHFLGMLAAMTDGTRLTQLAENFAALKKTVDRNEESRK
jgi:hypothetical protein